MFQMFNKRVSKAKRILQIGFVTQDAEIGAQLKDFVSKRDGIDLRLIESAKVTTAAPPKDISVFVYDFDASREASLQEFERFMSQRPQDVPVIVLSPSVEDELVRWFLRLRVSDWLKTPLSPGELITACGRALSQSSSGKQDVTCLTFMGARGGVGATTLALHAAQIVSGKALEAGSTCLVDLDLVSGSCADYLDLQPGWQIDELVANPGRIDSHMLDSMVVKHPAGINVLSAQRKYLERHTFSEEVVTRALDIAAQKYQSLVVDLPRHGESWTDGVVLGSSSLFIVTEFTIPGLKAARRMIGDLSDRYGDEVNPRVIVNKYERSLFGSSISPKEVNELLGASLAGYVSNDAKLVREAIDRGIPTSAIKNKNAIFKDLSKILGT